MPYVKDFSELTGRGSFNVEVPKWLPITIEYGYAYYGQVPFLYWRLKGTTHTFKIGMYEIMEKTQGDFEQHVTEFLKSFRNEYLSWLKQGFTAEWMREYHEQYREFIEL